MAIQTESLRKNENLIIFNVNYSNIITFYTEIFVIEVLILDKKVIDEQFHGYLTLNTINILIIFMLSRNIHWNCIFFEYIYHFDFEYSKKINAWIKWLVLNGLITYHSVKWQEALRYVFLVTGFVDMKRGA